MVLDARQQSAQCCVELQPTCLSATNISSTSPLYSFSRAAKQLINSHIRGCRACRQQRQQQEHQECQKAVLSCQFRGC
jgi:hypothetical protein